jgi:hypothetical protein
MGSGLGSWPVFLEKALTAFDKDRNFAPQNAYYGRSVGGYGSEGLALLLGVDTMQLPISPPTVTTSDPLGKRFNFTMLMLFSGGFDIAVQGDQQTLSDIFGPNHANDWVTWKAWLLTKQPADLGVELWDKIIDKQTEIRIAWDRGKVWDTEIKHKLDGTFRVEHFQQWFTAKAGTLSPLLVQAVVAYVRRFGALAGKRGTGIYAVSQMNTFNYMYGLCTSGVPMTASTCHYIGKESKTSTKKTYSDEIIKGLVPNHEYTVLNVHSTNNLCYIQLLNPWGAVGRKLVSAVHSPHLHIPGHSAPVAESSGPFFDLDLDDFTKRFRCISHTVQKIRDPDK